jgi:hypothetical protein
MRKILAIAFVFSLGQVAFGQQSYNLSGFNAVAFGVPGTCHVQQGSRFKVEIDGDEDDLDRLEVEVKGNRLVISTKRGNWNWNSGKIEARITMPEIEGLSVSGSGELVTNGRLNVADLDMSVSGSGDLRVELDGSLIEASISGSGKIIAGGTATEIDLSISGSGKFDGEDLKAQKVKARISGSGNAKVYASEEVDATISGSGTVYYKGDPERKFSKASGSGKLRAL